MDITVTHGENACSVQHCVTFVLLFSCRMPSEMKLSGELTSISLRCMRLFYIVSTKMTGFCGFNVLSRAEFQRFDSNRWRHGSCGSSDSRVGRPGKSRFSVLVLNLKLVSCCILSGIPDRAGWSDEGEGQLGEDHRRLRRDEERKRCADCQTEGKVLNENVINFGAVYIFFVLF